MRSPSKSSPSLECARLAKIPFFLPKTNMIDKNHDQESDTSPNWKVDNRPMPEFGYADIECEWNQQEDYNLFEQNQIDLDGEDY